MAKRKQKSDEVFALKDKILLPVLAAAVIVSGSMLYNYKGIAKNRQYNDILSMDTIYNNIFINNCEVAGLTKQQAADKLAVEVQQKKLEVKSLYLQIPGGGEEDVIELNYKDLGMKYDFEPMIESAYNFGRTGSAEERIAVIDELENKGEFYTAEFSYDKDKVMSVLKSYEAEINKQLKNNKTMDVERTAKMVYEMLDIDSYDSYIHIPTK